MKFNNIFAKHKERVEKVKGFTENNKVFIVMAILAAIFLAGNFFLRKEDNQPSEVTETEITESEIAVSDETEYDFWGEPPSNTVITESAPPETVSSEPSQENTATEEKEQWRFYPIDLIILGIGGGICFVMILREKKRAKEKLQ